MPAPRTTLDRFRRDLTARNLRANSIDAYVRSVQRFLRHVDRPPSRVTESQLRDYVIALGEQCAPRTVNQSIAALRCFYTDTLRRPKLVGRLHNLKVTDPLPDILSGSEVRRLFQVTHSPKYRAFWLLLYGAGLRVSEACALCVDDIDSERMLLRIRRAKTEPRYIPLTQPVLDGLRQYWSATRPPGPHLFPGRGRNEVMTRVGVKNALDAACLRAGIKKHITPHSLRHAYATHLMDTGADLRTVQVLLGHANPSSTLRYTRLSRARLVATPSPIELLHDERGRVLG